MKTRIRWTALAMSAALFGCGNDAVDLPVDQDASSGDDGSSPSDATGGDGGGGGDGASTDTGAGGDGQSSDGSADDGAVGEGGDDGGSASDAGAVVGNDGGWFGNEGGTCFPLGQTCLSPSDCCSGTCTGNACQPPACASDGTSCTSGGECCSGSCGGGNTCTALNAQCKTLGNACSNGAECCSSLCSGTICSQPSYCGQQGDVCSANADCCGGLCTKAGGASLGTCGQPPTTGAQCSMVDGVVCGGSVGLLLDGGAAPFSDGGIPACGGSCCSRSCAPWGPTGVMICQPATGCRPVGDVCLSDSDCCGGPGVPGPIPNSGHTATCDITVPNLVGVCHNPSGCKPNGDICRLQSNSCNATDECCSGNVQQHDTCKQDLLGIPRCANETCVGGGSACATSADCCSGLPCVPDPAYAGPDGGVPEFICANTACIPAAGLCTTNADCCPGNVCNRPLGASSGSCASLNPPPDGGVGDGGSAGDGGGVGDGGFVGDGGSGPDAGDAGGPCSLYGQVCGATANCCNGVPCTDGRCVALP